jgi:hypothetical protein
MIIKNSGENLQSIEPNFVIGTFEGFPLKSSTIWDNSTFLDKQGTP